MKAYKAELMKTLRDYLVKELNTRANSLGLDEIGQTETGQTATLGTTLTSPTLFLAIPSRSVIDKDFVEYGVDLGINFPSPTPEDAESIGDSWEDILEDILRNDCELGGIGHISESEAIESVYSPGMGFVFLQFTLEIDRHGN